MIQFNFPQPNPYSQLTQLKIPLQDVPIFKIGFLQPKKLILILIFSATQFQPELDPLVSFSISMREPDTENLEKQKKMHSPRSQSSPSFVLLSELKLFSSFFR